MSSAAGSKSNRPHRHPLVRACPLCGVTMLASKSDEEKADCDTFTCPRCGCVITSSREETSPAPGPPRVNRGP
jgi:hypothetical protein